MRGSGESCPPRPPAAIAESSSCIRHGSARRRPEPPCSRTARRARTAYPSFACAADRGSSPYRPAAREKNLSSNRIKATSSAAPPSSGLTGTCGSGVNVRDGRGHGIGLGHDRRSHHNGFRVVQFERTAGGEGQPETAPPRASAGRVAWTSGQAVQVRLKPSGPARVQRYGLAKELDRLIEGMSAASARPASDSAWSALSARGPANWSTVLRTDHSWPASRAD